MEGGWISYKKWLLPLKQITIKQDRVQLNNNMMIVN